MLYRFDVANLIINSIITKFFTCFFKAERSEGVAETEFRFERQFFTLHFLGSDSMFSATNSSNFDAVVPCYKTENNHSIHAKDHAPFRRDSDRHIPVSHFAKASQNELSVSFFVPHRASCFAC